jgi:NADPH2:quinone reductase
MGTDQVRALVVTSHGGPEVLAVEDRPAPTPRPDEVVIEVAAAGVNFIDVYQRTGGYPIETPFVLGGECAGTVAALGSDVDEFAVGDLVATAAASGAMASLTAVPASGVVPVPAGVSPEQAAAAMLQGMTAHYLVTSVFVVGEGHEVLIHAAAGGVGQLLVQLCKARGAHVVATVGAESKAEIAMALGADVVIRYDQVGDLAQAVRAASHGGVHVAYDGVGKATFDASLASLRRRGMLALFGAASGPVPPVDPQRLNSGGSLFLTRPTLAHYAGERDELLWRSGEILSAIADGSLRIDIGGTYPLHQAAEAYRALEGRQTTGKLLIIP